MSDAVIGMVIAGIGSLLTLIIPVIVNWRKNRLELDKVAAEIDKIDLETIKELKTQVNELVVENKEMRKENKEMESRIKYLEKEHSRYANGLARAIKFINAKLPNETIPDFLLDTGELKRHQK